MNPKVSRVSAVLNPLQVFISSSFVSCFDIPRANTGNEFGWKQFTTDPTKHDEVDKNCNRGSAVQYKPVGLERSQKIIAFLTPILTRNTLYFNS